MANRTFYPVDTADNELKIIATSFTTNGSSNPTVFDTKHISGVVWNATGDWTVTLRHSYVSLKAALVFPSNVTVADYTSVGHTIGASTARITLRAAGAANDGGTATIMNIVMFVKNSSV